MCVKMPSQSPGSFKSYAGGLSDLYWAFPPNSWLHINSTDCFSSNISSTVVVCPSSVSLSGLQHGTVCQESSGYMVYPCVTWLAPAFAVRQVKVRHTRSVDNVTPGLSLACPRTSPPIGLKQTVSEMHGNRKDLPCMAELFYAKDDEI